MNLYDNKTFIEMDEGIRPGGLSLTEHLIKLCGFNAGDKLLDAGCGTGISLEFIRQNYSFETAGIDTSDILLRTGMEKFKSLKLVHGDAGALPFQNNSFNGVLAECSLSVMDDPCKVLNEIYRVLADGGKLAMSDVYLREPEFAERVKNYQFNRCITGAFTYNEIMSMLYCSGFTPVVWEDHSNLWREFVARILLNNDSFYELVLSGSPAEYNSVFLSPEVLKAKPGYFSLIAEKRQLMS